MLSPGIKCAPEGYIRKERSQHLQFKEARSMLRVKTSIAQKLGLSFAAVLLVMSVSSVLVYRDSRSANKILERMIATRYPAAVSRFEILAGLQQTEDALRSEVVFAGDAKRARTIRLSRLEAWARVDRAMKSYHALSKNLTLQGNLDHLQTIEATLPLLRGAQEQVAAIAAQGASFRRPA